MTAIEHIAPQKEPDLKTLGTFAQGLREKAEKTQLQIADAAGVKRETISAWERASQGAKPDLHSVYKWARAIPASEEDEKQMARLHSPNLDIDKYWKAYQDNAGLLALDTDWLSNNVEPKNRFGKYLTACRKRTHLTQDELANKIDIKVKTLKAIENHQPCSKAMKNEIADTLGKLLGEKKFNRTRFDALYDLSNPLLNDEKSAQQRELRAIKKINATPHSMQLLGTTPSHQKEIFH